MYVLSSVCFLTCTVYFYSGLSPLDLFSCHLIIKVSTGKLPCRFYCVFFTYSPAQWWKAELSQGEYGKSQGELGAVVLHWDFGGSDNFSLISPVGFLTCAYVFCWAEIFLVTISHVPIENPIILHILSTLLVLGLVGILFCIWKFHFGM